MVPKTTSEHLMYSTVRLETNSGTGTGSFFQFKIRDSYVPVIITNKHVVNNNPDENVTFSLHTCENAESNEPSGNIKITYISHWVFHQDKDLCFCYVLPLFEEVKKRFGKHVFYRSLAEKLIASKEQLLSLNAVEELIMIGYPIGLWDERNNLPIFRRGYTACHPGIDFNEDNVGLADMACFPGSSGSPVLILNEGGYLDKNKGIMLGGNRTLLLGYLYAGPVYSASGEIIVKSIPTANPTISTSTQVMINLGYFIKAVELEEFKKMIEKHLATRR